MIVKTIKTGVFSLETANINFNTKDLASIHQLVSTISKAIVNNPVTFLIKNNVANYIFILMDVKTPALKKYLIASMLLPLKGATSSKVIIKEIPHPIPEDYDLWDKSSPYSDSIETLPTLESFIITLPIDFSPYQNKDVFSDIFNDVEKSKPYKVETEYSVTTEDFKVIGLTKEQSIVISNILDGIEKLAEHEVNVNTKSLRNKFINSLSEPFIVHLNKK